MFVCSYLVKLLNSISRNVFLFGPWLSLGLTLTICSKLSFFHTSTCCIWCLSILSLLFYEDVNIKIIWMIQDLFLYVFFLLNLWLIVISFLVLSFVSGEETYKYVYLFLSRFLRTLLCCLTVVTDNDPFSATPLPVCPSQLK